ncbi:MAG: hypothetical protein JNK65_00280 [Deltaproteobacteria bacterium]|nr:hypothetical protein [Deltaproteobacteria bacterium]
MKTKHISSLFMLMICSLFPFHHLWAEESELRTLEKAALRYASIDAEEVAHWKSRVRWAAALPRIVVGYDQKSGTQINNNIQDSISVSSSGVSIGPPESRFTQDNQLDRGASVKAYWDLNELIFSKDTLAVSAEARYRTVMRSQIVEELHQAYFERKKILQKLSERGELNQGIAADLPPALQIRLEELEAKLDSLTGGFFSKMKGSQK